MKIDENLIVLERSLNVEGWKGSCTARILRMLFCALKESITFRSTVSGVCWCVRWFSLRAIDLCSR